uniref:Metalloendopeptidase n=1 Tax=Romanomermis culicivorax TaxID=13658 RepID=A0A915JFV2_ROMCU
MNDKLGLARLIVAFFGENLVNEMHNVLTKKFCSNKQIQAGIYLNGDKRKVKRAIKQYRNKDGSAIWDRKYRKGLWNPDEPIEYSFDGSLTSNQKEFVHLAFEYYRNFTCLNFESVDDDHFDYRIVFRSLKQEGCNANLGRGEKHGAAQFINLGSSCFHVGAITHEIGHALGLIHEHQRPDRDNYVAIFWWNIEPDYIFAFEMDKSHHNYTTLGLPYDYGSIMHYSGHLYGLYQFFSLPTKQTIWTKKQAYQLTIGMLTEVSFYDLKGLNMVYCAELLAKGSTLVIEIIFDI